MKLLFTLARQYPWQTLLTLAGISFAGVSEGFGISALLPLVNTVFTQKIQVEDGRRSASEWSSIIDEMVKVPCRPSGSARP